MQLKYWCFLPCRDWESFHFVPILDQSQMETARHFMTILCLYCIAELHIHIQFSTIVAFPVTVPIYSLFFHVSFKFPSIHLLFSSAATWLAQDKGNLQPSLRWDPVPSPPWPWSSFRSFQYSLPQPLTFFSFSTTAPDPAPRCPSSAQIPAQKQLWKLICTPCMTHPFPGHSPDPWATHPLRWDLMSPAPCSENTGTG